jgi:aldehyde dehydrogenase (NAD+)
MVTASQAQQSELDLASILDKQRRFFRSGATRPYTFRQKQLQSLRALVRDHESRIHEALAADLAKPAFEAFASETGFVISECSHALEHLETWMEPERVKTPLTFFPSKSFVRREPMGLVLIIAPWNYPFQLVMSPLAAALAAGNCALLKPSEWTLHTSELVAELAASYFPAEVVSTVLGDAKTAEALLAERFDHIFFTGGCEVGRIVATAAAKHLTPVTLELGGKSPAIIDEKVDLEVAARRVTWGKFLNAGQTCIAPDYLLVPETLAEDFLSLMKKNVRRFFGDDPRTSPDFARIVNHRHFDRLSGYLEDGRIVIGGESERDERYIAPTILAEVPEGARSLDEEIFGPILPVLTYRGLDEAIEITLRHPNPLALYFFSKDRKNQERVMQEIPFGGGAINDALIQFSNPDLPFGGRGASGNGSYHGRYGFETFSHKKSVVEGSTLFDPRIRYPPYGGKLRWLKMLIK